MGTREKVQRWIEIVYLVCLAIFLVYRSSDNTMIRKELGITRCIPAEYCWMAVMLLLIVVRIVYLRSYSALELVVAAAFCAAMFLSWRHSGRYWIEMTSLLIVGAKGVSFDRIARVFLVTVGAVVGISLVLSLAGVVTNLEYIRYVSDPSAPGGSVGVKRYAFGTTYPTTFSEFVFFLSAAWLYLRRRTAKIFDVIGLAAVAVFLYKGVDAITDVACVGALAVIALGVVVVRHVGFGEKVFEGMPNHLSSCEDGMTGEPDDTSSGRDELAHQSDYGQADTGSLKTGTSRIWRVLYFLCAPFVAVPVVCAAVMTALMIMYDSAKPSWLTMDTLLHLRLSLGYEGLKEYGIHPFGALVKYRMTGGDVDLVGRADYFNLDCSYHLILINFGVVILLFIVGFFTLTSVRAWQMKDLVLLFTIAVISLECVMENRMIHPQFDVFLLAFFADLWAAGGGKYTALRGKV